MKTWMKVDGCQNKWRVDKSYTCNCLWGDFQNSAMLRIESMLSLPLESTACIIIYILYLYLRFVFIVKDMVGTRNTRRTVAERDEFEDAPLRKDPDNSGSDSDDAPEEVGFTASKKASSNYIFGEPCPAIYPCTTL